MHFTRDLKLHPEPQTSSPSHIVNYIQTMKRHLPESNVTDSVGNGFGLVTDQQHLWSTIPNHFDLQAIQSHPFQELSVVTHTWPRHLSFKVHLHKIRSYHRSFRSSNVKIRGRKHVHTRAKRILLLRTQGTRVYCHGTNTRGNARSQVATTV
jgi:hypothetical protein